MSEYECVARGKLKLKSDGEVKKKKKKKDKDKELTKEKIEKVSSETIEIKSPSGSSGRQLTKAEVSFKKMQEKMVSRFHWIDREIAISRHPRNFQNIQ
jgi:protein FAM32A